MVILQLLRTNGVSVLLLAET